MIGMLIGVLREINGTIGLIETKSGICYEVFLTPKLISQYIPSSLCELYTYFQVRDDAHVLYGFATKEEKYFFKELIDVPGVGPKTAFAVISYASPKDMISAVKENDVGYFSKIPGLGKKTALKIILEFSQKLKSEFKFNISEYSNDEKTVIEALVALGYKNQDAKKMIEKIPKDLSIEDKIRYALKLTLKS